VSIAVSKLGMPLLKAWLSGIYPEDKQFLVAGFARRNLLAKLPAFAAGLLAFSLLQDRVRSQKIVMTSLLLLTPAIYFESAISGSNVGDLLFDSVHVGLLFALLVLMLATFPPRILVNRWIAAVGKLSYSMYVLQFLVLDLSKRILPAITGDGASLLYFAFVATATGSLASLTYRFIEQPGVTLGKSLIRHWEEPATLSDRSSLSPESSKP
jgi:peptidoglycan/LPS O-acetylase OafA/YrhL